MTYKADVTYAILAKQDVKIHKKSLILKILFNTDLVNNLIIINFASKLKKNILLHFYHEMSKRNNTGKSRNRLVSALGILALSFLLSFIISQPFSISVATLLSSNDRSDFAVSDYFNVVANSRNKRYLDTNIVVVNIDTLDATRRNDIAQIIEVINALEPKAIGLDVIFERPQDDDTQLIEAIADCDNIVIASTLRQVEGTLMFTPNKESFFRPLFDDKEYGVINIPSKFEKSVVRKFPTSFDMTDGTKRLSFVSALTQMTDTAAFRKLMSRDNMFETVK